MIRIWYPMLVLATLGTGGLIIALAVSPLGPLLRYSLFGLLAFSVAMAIAMHAGGGVAR